MNKEINNFRRQSLQNSTAKLNDMLVVPTMAAGNSIPFLQQSQKRQTHVRFPFIALLILFN